MSCDESSLVSDLTVDSSFPPAMRRSMHRESLKKAWRAHASYSAKLQLMKRQLEKTQLAARIVDLRNKIQLAKILDSLPDTQQGAAAGGGVVEAKKLEDDVSMIVKPGLRPTVSKDYSTSCADTRRTTEEDASQTQHQMKIQERRIEEEEQDNEEDSSENCEDGDLLVGFPCDREGRYTLS